jgi:predicted nucleic acid-binding protein
VISIDTNIVLDLLIADRAPHHEPAVRLFHAVLSSGEDAALAAHAVTTTKFLVEAASDRATALRAVDWLLAHLTIVPVDRSVLVRARSLGWRDFEDAVLAAASEASGCRRIVTRTVVDYAPDPVPAVTPLAYLASL